MKGVILHGGRGTRLRPITYSEVKQLVPIGGKPVSQYALEDMISAGIREIAIVVGDIGTEEVKELYGDGSKWNAQITYVYQDQPRGIGHAVGITEDFVNGDDFVVYLGDNILSGELGRLRSVFEKGGYDCMLTLTRVTDPTKYGVADIQDGKLMKLLEKPSNPPSDLVVVGVYFMKASAFEVIKSIKPSGRGEIELTDALQKMIDSGRKVGWKEIEGWWKDTGTMSDIIEANRLILDDCKTDIRSRAAQIGKVSGRVMIMEGVTIDASSRVRGPCYIGRDTKLVNAHIGPYTSIGNNCHIESVEIEDSILMDGCNVNGSGQIRINESLLGAGCRVVKGNTPRKATKLLIGRNSELEL